MSERAFSNWEDLQNGIHEIGQTLVERVARPSNVYTANNLEEWIKKVEDGKVVPGGTITREQALAWVELSDSLKTWLATPLAGCDKPPLAIIYEE